MAHGGATLANRYQILACVLDLSMQHTMENTMVDVWEFKVYAETSHSGFYYHETGDQKQGAGGRRVGGVRR